MSDIRNRHRRASDAIFADDQDLLESNDNRPVQSSIRGDERNIAVLFFLYLLQGVPLGLMQAIPIILTKNGVSYSQQALFSFVNWPFSLKLFWAPIVDSLYWPRIGRRKSWLVPCQYLIGFLMIILSFCIEPMLSKNNTNGSNFVWIVVAFVTLNFLAATQDIAVDGWALTMLKKHNVGYASTCNSVGQTAGYIFGFVVFVGLESRSFCNSYLRTEPQPHGLITVSGFLWFWGLAFFVTTSLVWAFKTEKAPSFADESLNIRQSYRTLLAVFKLRPIQILSVILLTAKFPFSAADALSGLKMIELGVSKEKLAFLAIPLVPLQIALPLVISKWTTGPYPMKVYLKAYPYRLFMSAVLVAFVWITPFFKTDGGFTNSYFVILLVIYAIHQVALYCMYVSQMAFFAKISDPAIGGTYMTLVNTLANMGGTWTSTVALYMVEKLTLKQCSNDEFNSCYNADDAKLCSNAGGKCDVQLDGYYLEVVVCTVVGILWLRWGKNAIRRLQSFPMSAFVVSDRNR